MRRAAIALLLVTILLGGAGNPAPSPSPLLAATPEILLSTLEGPVLRVGPPGSTHFVGLLANGEGAFGVAVAADGAFLAFTCGMTARADAWFSGDWYQGELAHAQPATAPGPDGETLILSWAMNGDVHAEVSTPGDSPRQAVAVPAAVADGLFRRDDADGVLGAIALPGNTVCAVKRTEDGQLLPAGTVPY